MADTPDRANFYCSQKFWWLSIDLSKRLTLSCCSADPAAIDLGWIKKNPGQMFNTPQLQAERTMMLNNQPVASCQTTCWQPESVGLPSRRTVMKSNVMAETEIHSVPRVLNIMVGNDCNMHCVYCCKQYSSAWMRDLVKNGPYQLDTTDNRYTINNVDRVLFKLGQKQLGSAAPTQQLLDEIKVLLQSVDADSMHVEISGGEPFLYLGLADLVKSIPKHITIRIVTGLGVAPSRFAQELEKLPLDQIEIAVSAENIDKFYEFSRNGNTWTQFNKNILLLQDKKVSYQFFSVVSNLTIHGLVDFIKYAGDTPMGYNFCNDPSFLCVNVLDPTSKNRVLEIVDQLPDRLSQLLKKSIMVEPTEQQRLNLKNYVNEFSVRQSVSLEIFPESFLEWINK